MDGRLNGRLNGRCDIRHRCFSERRFGRYDKELCEVVGPAGLERPAPAVVRTCQPIAHRQEISYPID